MQVTSGKWEIVNESDGLVQCLRWWHGGGKQRIVAKGVVRDRRELGEPVGDEGYVEQCQQSKCAVM